MCGGGGIPIVSDVVNVVTDVFDKADNWTEGAGELLADIDPGPALGDVGEFIDQSIIQPALDDPIATIATVAAVSTGQYWALPIIAGTATAARGGDIEDIAKSVGVAFVAAQAAPYVKTAMPAGTTIGGKIASSAATGAVLGAGAGASSAALNDGDVGQAALRGGVAGGVAGGVGRAVGEGYNLIKTELGIPSSTRPNYDFGIKGPTAPLDINTDLSSINAINPPSSGFGIKPPVDGATFGQLSPALTSNYYNQPKPVDNIFEREGKKLVADAITGEILEEIFDPQQGFIQRPASSRRIRTSGLGGMDDVDLSSVDNTASSSTIMPSKYELRKFVNDAGNSTLVSFKDNQPQTPIPAGYKQVETIGAAKGGLIESQQPSTTMVKYSKKPLLAQRKKEIKIAKKGLASRK